MSGRALVLWVPTDSDDLPLDSSKCHVAARIPGSRPRYRQCRQFGPYERRTFADGNDYLCCLTHKAMADGDFPRQAVKDGP